MRYYITVIKHYSVTSRLYVTFVTFIIIWPGKYSNRCEKRSSSTIHCYYDRFRGKFRNHNVTGITFEFILSTSSVIIGFVGSITAYETSLQIPCKLRSDSTLTRTFSPPRSKNTRFSVAAAVAVVASPKTRLHRSRREKPFPREILTLSFS